MMKIEYKCKLCGKPGTAEFPEDAPPEAVDKWFPMLAHNHCADIRRGRDDSEDLIVHACYSISIADEKKKGALIARLRPSLEKWTRRYAECIAEILDREHVWSSHFVDLLIEQPEKASQILSKYRDKIRAQPRRREGAD